MSPSASDVSIVTVNWNGLGHLRTLLPSLTGLEAGEIIVVDNGSSDGSTDWLRHNHPAVRIIENDDNRGFAHPCNQAAEEAEGIHLAFINNDMRADNRWLEAALPLLSAETPCVGSRILSWDGRRVDFNGSSLQYLGYALQRDIGKLAEDVAADDRILFPCGGAMLVERGLFLDLGGFDADFFAIFEDVDFGWRVWLAGKEVAFAPGSIVFHKGHATFAEHPDEKMRYLMHRNALLTILKNYQEENFRKILPLAVSLAISRAVRLSGVRKESFYLWEDTRSRLGRREPQAFEQLIDALNHLVAVEDVLGCFPRWMAKRRKVQALRRRGDEEIIRLFGDPLRAIVEDPEYTEKEMEWLRWLQLGPWPGWDEAAKRLEGLPEKLAERIGGLRSELKAEQWRAGKLRTSAPAETPPPSWKALLRTLRREGLRSAWSRFREQVERGI